MQKDRFFPLSTVIEIFTFWTAKTAASQIIKASDFFRKLCLGTYSFLTCTDEAYRIKDGAVVERAGSNGKAARRFRGAVKLRNNGKTPEFANSK